MKTSISHLPPNKQAEIKRIKDALIPKYAEIEKWNTRLPVRSSAFHLLLF